MRRLIALIFGIAFSCLAAAADPMSAVPSVLPPDQIILEFLPLYNRGLFADYEMYIDRLNDLLYERLSGAPSLELLERESADRIVKELLLQKSGAVDEKSKAKDEIQGADFVVGGLELYECR